MSNAITGGSEKQNAWAERIRGEFIAGLDAQERFAKDDWKILLRLNVARRLVPTQTSARWWIDHRDFGKALYGFLNMLTDAEVTAEARRVYDTAKTAALAAGESETEADKIARSDALAAVAAITDLDRPGRFDRETLTFGTQR